MAVVKGGKYAEALVKVLKKHGADPSIRNNDFNRDEDEDHNDVSKKVVFPNSKYQYQFCLNF